MLNFCLAVCGNLAAPCHQQLDNLNFRTFVNPFLKEKSVHHVTCVCIPAHFSGLSGKRSPSVWTQNVYCCRGSVNPSRAWMCFIAVLRRCYIAAKKFCLESKRTVLGRGAEHDRPVRLFWPNMTGGTKSKQKANMTNSEKWTRELGQDPKRIPVPWLEATNSLDGNN